MRLMLKVFALIQLLLVALLPAAHTLHRNEFPPDFVFGASTSAYQVEGAANEDGRKPSIWDTFAHAGNGNMYEGDGDVACDQYHKYKDMQHGFIGFNLLTFGLIPQSNTSEDISATKRAQDFFVGWFLNPFTFGDYPDIMKKNAGLRLPSFTQKESNLVKGSIDFIGINFYYTHYVKNSPGSLGMEDTSYTADMGVELLSFPQNETFTSEIPITTWSLQGVLDSLKNAYGNVPIYIHENGQNTPRNSSLDDWPRVKYLQAYVGSMLDALRNPMVTTEIEKIPMLSQTPLVHYAA
ncbi:Hydroxyisourate hydrolase [Spatholobus suberectus]|nr:Hydroxyisourate hydrolase [Spatholobus suberectus]